MKRGQTTKGFTIVELLIVIVVIGILAAITIVAYGSVQTNAKNKQVISGAAVYNKAVMQYQAETGSIPTIEGCLGANYPSSQCWTGAPVRAVNASLDTLLAPYLSNKPTLATSLLPMDGTNNRAGLAYIYNFPAAGQAELRFYLNGNGQNCSVAGFLSANEGTLTQCYKRF
ncbi:MAG: type II secretion system protein [Candidatus Saccharimonadales bacterium]